MLTKVNDRVMLSDTTYSVGKQLVQIWIPAASAAYFTLSKIWGLPAAEEIVGTMACVATFLGAVLRISSSQYDASDAAYDGDAVVSTMSDGKKLYSLELNGDPEELDQKDSITFKVKTPKKS